MDVFSPFPTAVASPLPLTIAVTWPAVLELERDLGVIELHCLIIAKRPVFDTDEWARVEQIVRRLLVDPVHQRVAINHLRTVAEGGAA